MTNIGIHSIGVFLPSEVRTNDWWPAHTVDAWRAKRAQGVTRALEPERAASRTASAMAAAMASVKGDPFEGAKERRVMSKDMQPSDMELAAARDAIARAGIDASEIDCVLAGSAIPDHHQSPTSCRIHHQLGLRPSAMTYSGEGACNAFAQHLMLGEALIKAGRARKALVVQSTAESRVLRQDDPFSAWFGDGATAAILGEVADGYGLLGQATMTDGAWYGALIVGQPERAWYEEGRNVLYLGNPKMARDQLFAIADAANPLLDKALFDAKLTRSDITVIATHQAAGWFGAAIQAVWDLPTARRVDSFPFAASVMGSNIPLVLATGEREGILHEGDVVATLSGAGGMTMNVTVMRWGGNTARKR